MGAGWPGAGRSVRVQSVGVLRRMGGLTRPWDFILLSPGGHVRSQQINPQDCPRVAAQVCTALAEWPDMSHSPASPPSTTSYQKVCKTAGWQFSVSPGSGPGRSQCPSGSRGQTSPLATGLQPSAHVQLRTPHAPSSHLSFYFNDTLCECVFAPARLELRKGVGVPARSSHRGTALGRFWTTGLRAFEEFTIWDLTQIPFASKIQNGSRKNGINKCYVKCLQIVTLC